MAFYVQTDDGRTYRLVQVRAHKSAAKPAPKPPAPKPAPVKAKPRVSVTQAITGKGRVPCSYGAVTCKGRSFLPNGSGATHHTSCEQGRAALAQR